MGEQAKSDSRLAAIGLSALSTGVRGAIFFVLMVDGGYADGWNLSRGYC